MTPQKPKTIGTYFSGLGCVEIGAMAAGVKPAFAVEYDPSAPDLSAAIADAHEANIPDALLLRQDVCQVDPADLPWVHWFHASPVCKNFSVAKSDGTEDEVDMAAAEATARYIQHHKPTFVTIENVWMYRKSRSWQIIFNALDRACYGVRVQKVNMADYGVPQTRIRMVVTAGLGYTPRRLRPTHQSNPSTAPTLFDVGLPRWVSWYEAIEDLIPTLPDSELADWQLKRLPTNLVESVCFVNPNTGCGGNSYRGEGSPATSVPSTYQGTARALLVTGANSNGGSDREGTAPAATVGDTQRVGNTPRAVLFNGMDMKSTARDMGGAEAEGPAGTVTAGDFRRPSQVPIVWLINDADSRYPYIPGERPSGTLVTNVTGGTPPRLLELPGTVKKLTPRALARLQSIPDWVVLPENSRDAVAAIGNGVPCLFMQRLAQQLVTKEV